MLDMLNRDAVDVLLEAINAKNPSLKVPLTKHNVTVSPVTVLDPATNGGMDAEVTITAVKDGPFVGYLKFQYARAELSEAYGADIKLDVTGLALPEVPFNTKIDHAFGAESMPFAEDLVLTIPTISNDFKAYEPAGLSSDADKSHIWKSAKRYPTIHCRIMPNGTLRMKAYDVSSKVPAEIKADDWTYGHGRGMAFLGGKLYIASAFDGSVVIKTPTLAGIDFNTGEYKVYFMEAGTPIIVSSSLELYKIGELTFDADGPVAVTAMTKSSDSITPNAELFNTMISSYTEYNGKMSLISPEHMESILIDVNTNTYTITAMAGDGLLEGSVLSSRKFLQYVSDKTDTIIVSAEGHVYYYKYVTNTFEVYCGTYAYSHPDHVWYDFYTYGYTVYALGVKDGAFAYYELRLIDYKPKPVYDFNIPDLDPSIMLRIGGYEAPYEDPMITITYANSTNCVVDLYKNDNMTVTDSIAVPKNTYTIYQKDSGPLSQAMFSDDGKLVAVDLSEDHELTGNKTK